MRTEELAVSGKLCASMALRFEAACRAADLSPEMAVEEAVIAWVETVEADQRLALRIRAMIREVQ